jgi:hypothetical protein
MAEDYIAKGVRDNIADCDADIAQISANIARAQADGDEYAMKEQIEGYAAAQSRRRDLMAAYNEHMQRQTPQAAASTEAEFLARSPERMNGEDVDRIFSKSKYYSKGQWQDPEINARVMAGVREVQARKREGR